MMADFGKEILFENICNGNINMTFRGVKDFRKQA
jgi:hypothetical protein